jgi:hypothetical protein
MLRPRGSNAPELIKEGIVLYQVFYAITDEELARLGQSD